MHPISTVRSMRLWGAPGGGRRAARVRQWKQRQWTRFWGEIMGLVSDVLSWKDL